MINCSPLFSASDIISPGHNKANVGIRSLHSSRTSFISITLPRGHNGAASGTKETFQSLPWVSMPHSRGYGHIFRLAETAIVVKIAHRIVNGSADDDARAAESLEILRRERALYERLATKPQHPNIAEYFLSTDVAIFIKFEPETLERRLSRRSAAPIPDDGNSAGSRRSQAPRPGSRALVTSMATCGRKFLLDQTQHVKICDFGGAQKPGCKVEVATCASYRPGIDVFAGPAHEQFAIGSCIYTIRTGEVPYGQWETHEQFKKMYDALV